MEPQSRIVTPTLRDATPVTRAEMTRRSAGSPRSSRQVPTTSCPASIASSRRGITIEAAGAPGSPVAAPAGAVGTVSGGMAPDDVRERCRHIRDILAGQVREEWEREDALRGARGLRQVPRREPELFAIEAMKVQRLEMQTHPDVGLQQCLHDRVAADAERLEPEADDEQVPRVAGGVGDGREHLHRRQALERG